MYTERQRALLREAMPVHGDAEHFVIDNRAVFDAFQRLVNGEQGEMMPPEVQLEGDGEQARVLFELAQENGVHAAIVLIAPNGRRLVVHAPAPRPSEHEIDRER